MADFTLTIFHGNTFVLPVILTDSKRKPVVLTGATIKFLLGEITQEDSAVTIARDDENGKFTVTITAAKMKTLEITPLVERMYQTDVDTGYDLEVEITYPDPEIKKTYLQGKVHIKEVKIP